MSDDIIEVNIKHSDIQNFTTLWAKLSKQEITDEGLSRMYMPEDLKDVQGTAKLIYGLVAFQVDVVYHRRYEKINRHEKQDNCSDQLDVPKDLLNEYQFQRYDGIFDIRIKNGSKANLIIESVEDKNQVIIIPFTREERSNTTDLIVQMCNFEHPLLFSPSFHQYRYIIQTDGTILEFYGFLHTRDVCRRIYKDQFFASMVLDHGFYLNHFFPLKKN